MSKRKKQQAIRPFPLQSKVLLGITFLSIVMVGTLSTPSSHAFSSSCARFQAQDDGARGVYFNKKSRITAPIPNFIESISKLPSPILDSHSEWIDLYWAAWDLAFQNFKSPRPNSSLTANYIDAAFSDHLFQWDTIFMMQFAVYANSAFPAISSLDNFYSHQHRNGFISRELVAATGADYCYLDSKNMINPPLFAWAETQYARFTGDTSRYPEVYPSLVHYAIYLESARKAHASVHQLYWNTGLGSGMDNSPRDLDAESGWVDMSSQMVIMYQSLSEIAFFLGQTKDAHEFSLHAQSITERIQKYMWNEKEGLYFDVDSRGIQKSHKTAAGFWPLLAHIPSAEQVKKVLNHLKNPQTFWRSNVWPSLAADEPKYSSEGNYWRGGVWAPMNSMIIEGLKNYPEVSGTTELIKEASERYLRNLSEVFSKTQTLWELYKPDSPAPGQKWWLIRGRSDFVGWSGIGPIQFLIENVIGIQIDPSHNRILWRVQGTAHQGVNNLTVGHNHISLEVEARSSQESPLVFVSHSDQPMRLQVMTQSKVFWHEIKTGQERWTQAL